MSAIIEKKSSRSSETEVDRAIEDFSVKLLSGEFSKRDLEDYESLLTQRMNRLVKLPSAKVAASRRRIFLNRWAS